MLFHFLLGMILLKFVEMHKRRGLLLKLGLAFAFKYVTIQGCTVFAIANKSFFYCFILFAEWSFVLHDFISELNRIEYLFETG